MTPMMGTATVSDANSCRPAFCYITHCRSYDEHRSGAGDQHEEEAIGQAVAQAAEAQADEAREG